MNPEESNEIPAEAWAQFFSDLRDNLDAWEEAMLLLEHAPPTDELLATIFRAVHSIKGAAAMYHHDEIAQLAHQVESLFTAIRRGELAYADSLINLTFQAHDAIGQLVTDPDGAWFLPELARQLSGILAPLTPSPAPQPTATKANLASSVNNYLIRFRFNPHKPLLAAATSPIWYLDALREAGECSIRADSQYLPLLSALNPAVCYIAWDVRLRTERDEASLRDEFQFVADDLTLLTIKAIRAPEFAAASSSHGAKRLKILIADDLFPNRLVLRQILAPYGDCDMVVDGEESVECFSLALEDGKPYDLVLMDIMMPVMDGYEALAQIRQLEKECGTRPKEETVVIMVTAVDSPQSIFRAFYQGGCTDYLVKPVTKESLLAKLQEVGLLPDDLPE